MIYAERPERPFWVTANPAPEIAEHKHIGSPGLSRPTFPVRSPSSFSPQIVTAIDREAREARGSHFPTTHRGRARGKCSCQPRLPSSSPTLFSRLLFYSAHIGLFTGEGKPQPRNRKRVSCRRFPKVLPFDSTLLLSVRERGKCYHLRAPGQGYPQF